MKITYQLDKLDLIKVLAKVYNVKSDQVTVGVETKQDPDGLHDEPVAIIRAETDIPGEKGK